MPVSVHLWTPFVMDTWQKVKETIGMKDTTQRGADDLVVVKYGTGYTFPKALLNSCFIENLEGVLQFDVLRLLGYAFNDDAVLDSATPPNVTSGWLRQPAISPLTFSPLEVFGTYKPYSSSSSQRPSLCYWYNRAQMIGLNDATLKYTRFFTTNLHANDPDASASEYLNDATKYKAVSWLAASPADTAGLAALNNCLDDGNYYIAADEVFPFRVSFVNTNIPSLSNLCKSLRGIAIEPVQSGVVSIDKNPLGLTTSGPNAPLVMSHFGLPSPDEDIAILQSTTNIPDMNDTSRWSDLQRMWYQLKTNCVRSGNETRWKDHTPSVLGGMDLRSGDFIAVYVTYSLNQSLTVIADTGVTLPTTVPTTPINLVGRINCSDPFPTPGVTPNTTEPTYTHNNLVVEWRFVVG